MSQSVISAKARTGTYLGQANERGTITFRGIRYAKFAGRWKKLSPLPDSEEVQEAFDYGPGCPQVRFQDWYQDYWDYPKDEADCFRLSLSTSSLEGKKPVFVFFHGGGNITGGIYVNRFHTEAFVDRNPDIVFVDFNYRLGILGNLCLDEYTDDPDYAYSGCLGALDQIAALRWIHENIACFGGDPDNVTVAGQSAGSASLFRHLTIPESWQYWNRVICESGTTFFNRPLSREKARVVTRRCAEIVGASTLQELLDTPVDKLMTVPPDQLRLENVEDGLTLREQTNFLLCTGDTGMVPSGKQIMLGSMNADMDQGVQIPDNFEKTLENVSNFCSMMFTSMTEQEAELYARTYLNGFGDPTKATAFIKNFSPEQARLLAAKYIARDPDREPFIAVSDMNNDIQFQSLLMMKSGALCRHNTVYHYIWQWYPKEVWPRRAIHSTDVPFVTNMEHDRPDIINAVNKDEVQRMYDVVQEIWGNFIRHARPDCGDVHGIAYDPQTKPILNIDLQPYYTFNPRSADIRLLGELFAEYCEVDV